MNGLVRNSTISNAFCNNIKVLFPFLPESR